jgi:hypothetical protein
MFDMDCRIVLFLQASQNSENDFSLVADDSILYNLFFSFRNCHQNNFYGIIPTILLLAFTLTDDAHLNSQDEMENLLRRHSLKEVR